MPDWLGAAQPVRKIKEVFRLNLRLRVGQQVRASFGAFLERTFDKCGSHSNGRRCPQVSLVRRDHLPRSPRPACNA